MTFNLRRMVGGGLVILALILLMVWFMSGPAAVEGLSPAWSDKFTTATVWYLILAAVVMLPGALLVKYGNRGKGSHVGRRTHQFR